MNRLALPCFVVLLLVLGGCEPNIAPAPGFGDPYPAPLNDPQITVHDEQLRAFLGFHPAIVVNDGVQPMQVEQPVRNMADRQYLIDYRIVFFDQVGREVEPVMSWRFQSMQPKQTVRLKANALDTRAVAYKLEVKWAQ